jgi:hypothetical protein
MTDFVIEDGKRIQAAFDVHLGKKITLSDAIAKWDAYSSRLDAQWIDVPILSNDIITCLYGVSNK